MMLRLKTKCDQNTYTHTLEIIPIFSLSRGMVSYTVFKNVETRKARNQV